jgi:hypothetical protein
VSPAQLSEGPSTAAHHADHLQRGGIADARATQLCLRHLSCLSEPQQWKAMQALQTASTTSTAQAGRRHLNGTGLRSACYTSTLHTGSMTNSRLYNATAKEFCDAQE